MRTRAPALPLLLLIATAGCAYDYLRIRDPDAFVDRPFPPPPTDMGVVDRGAPDAPLDAGVTDVPPPPDVRVMDVPADTSRPPRTGSCMLSNVVDLAPVAAPVGPSLVVTGSTVMSRDPLAQQTRVRPLVPPSMDCNNVGDISSPTRIFRYTVQSGPRVVATTNTGACSHVGSTVAGYDTLLYALPSCDAAGRRAPLACSDDDGVTLCRACASPAREGCRNLQSTVEVANQAPGDVIYFVVDGFTGMTGNFTLAVAENGLLPATPPSTVPAGTVVAARCTCPSAPPTVTTHTLPFPGGAFSDELSVFERPGQSVRGTRMIPLRTITAASATLRFRRVTYSLEGDCAMAVPRATFDLFLNNVLLASFVVSPTTAPGAPVSVLYTAASPIQRTASGVVPVELRLREVTPRVGCVQAELEPNPTGAAAVSAITLVGEP